MQLGQHNLVSVILATYNEEAFIEDTIRSLLAQTHTDFDIEILVIDGASTDATVAKLESFGSTTKVKLLRNPSRNTPVAFNIGLRAASGDYVCILGAHCRYPDNYIETCYREMLAHGAAGCSGRMITVPANDSASAKLAAWCLGHAFASSSNSVRTRQGGFADTIPYPLFRKAALLEVGGYNEELVRNQDNDMNQRLRDRGHRLYLTGKTQAIYYARPDVKSLWAYAYRSGAWNAITLRVNSRCMRLRHFAPFAFIASLLALATAALAARVFGHPMMVAGSALLAIIGTHLLLGLLAGIQTGWKERTALALLSPPVILGFHLAYGLGTVAGFLSSTKHFLSARRPATSVAASAK
jgi:glycosyltransferase involved in cell wall biosynthesis